VFLYIMCHISEVIECVKVSDKLNSDDHSTELMDILFRYVKLAFTIYNGHMYI